MADAAVRPWLGSFAEPCGGPAMRLICRSCWRWRQCSAPLPGRAHEVRPAYLEHERGPARRVQRAVEDADAGRDAPGARSGLLRPGRGPDPGRHPADGHRRRPDLARAGARASADRPCASPAWRPPSPTRSSASTFADGSTWVQRLTPQQPATVIPVQPQCLGGRRHLSRAWGRAHPDRHRPPAVRAGAAAPDRRGRGGW